MIPVVDTRVGKLRGRVSDGVLSFKGVPFAAPPFGVNRLRVPQPVEPWDGVRDSLEFGTRCGKGASFGSVRRRTASRALLTMRRGERRSPWVRGKRDVIQPDTA